MQSDTGLVQFIVMIKFLSVIILCFLFSPAYAQNMNAQKDDKFNASQTVKAPEVDLSKLKHTKSGRIDKLIDGLTLILKDGTIIRLTSIDIPDFHIWDDAPLTEAALKLLNQTLPEGTEVMLYQTRSAKAGRVNRMNHQLAHIVTKKDNIWIQGLLLSNGLARVYTAPQSTDLLNDMYLAEQQARNAKLGMWSDDSDYNILSPEQTAQHIGNFVIVEGTVLNVATIRNNIYLNFGKDWKKDFTIQIPSALRTKFSKELINIMDIQNKSVRVRGTLREYNGPLIELEDTAHLEILQKDPEKPNLDADSPIKAKKYNGSQQE